MYVGEDRLADLPYPDTHSPPAPPLLGLYSQGEGGTYSRKSHVSLPQGRGTCVGGGVLGAPFHDSVPWGR